MPTKIKPATSAFDELADVRRAARDAADAVSAAETAVNKSTRDHHAAVNAYRNYFTGLGRGDEPDPEREATLQAAVDDLERRSQQTELNLHGGQTAYIWQSLESLGRLEAAREHAQEAEDRVGWFIAENRDRIAETLTGQALEARDRLLAAIAELSGANSHWARVRASWIDLLHVSPADIPARPLDGVAMQRIENVHAQVHGGARDPRGAVPMPSALAPGADAEEAAAAAEDRQPRHQAPLRGWEHVPFIPSGPGGMGY